MPCLLRFFERYRPRIAWLLIPALFLASTGCRPASSGSEPTPSLQAASATQISTIASSTATPTDRDPTPPALPPIPTNTTLPSSTPSPELVQLTSDGCCVEPFWSPDGSQVLFLDKPGEDSPAGFWSIGLSGGEPELFTDLLGVYSQDFTYVAYPSNGDTIVQHVVNGEKWVIPNGGISISFSPDSSLIAWTEGDSGPPFDTARRRIYVSQVGGTGARELASFVGGGFASWFPDGRILASGRLSPQDEQQGFWIVSLDGAVDEILHTGRVRGASLSPGGNWLAYQVLFEEDPAANGLWIANTQTHESYKIDLFGGYRWRDGNRLLVIPLDLDSPIHQLMEIDVSNRAVTALTDPATTPFKVANGDWTVSPNGKHLVFVSADDHNLWLLPLP